VCAVISTREKLLNIFYILAPAGLEKCHSKEKRDSTIFFEPVSFMLEIKL
jgi:hypothetical protein